MTKNQNLLKSALCTSHMQTLLSGTNNKTLIKRSKEIKGQKKSCSMFNLPKVVINNQREVYKQVQQFERNILPQLLSSTTDEVFSQCLGESCHKIYRCTFGLEITYFCPDFCKSMGICWRGGAASKWHRFSSPGDVCRSLCPWKSD